jgi:hypothetical protein
VRVTGAIQARFQALSCRHAFECANEFAPTGWSECANELFIRTCGWFAGFLLEVNTDTEMHTLIAAFSALASAQWIGPHQHGLHVLGGFGTHADAGAPQHAGLF